MVVLYCVLGLLLFLLLPMCFPVGVRLGFRKEFQLELRYLWFRLPLLPAEEEESQPSAPEPKEEKPPKKEKKQSKDSARKTQMLEKMQKAPPRTGPCGSSLRSPFSSFSLSLLCFLPVPAFRFLYFQIVLKLFAHNVIPPIVSQFCILRPTPP